MSKITIKDSSLYVATTSQRRQSHLGASKNVSATCLVSQSHLGTSCYIARMSQICQFCLRTPETSQRRLNQVRLIDVSVETSQHDPVRSNLSVEWVNLFRVLGSRFFWHLRWFSLFKVPASTLLQHLKDVSLIQAPAVTSLLRVKLVSFIQVTIVTSL